MQYNTLKFNCLRPLFNRTDVYSIIDDILDKHNICIDSLIDANDIIEDYLKRKPKYDESWVVLLNDYMHIDTINMIRKEVIEGILKVLLDEINSYYNHIDCVCIPPNDKLYTLTMRYQCPIFKLDYYDPFMPYLFIGYGMITYGLVDTMNIILYYDEDIAQKFLSFIDSRNTIKNVSEMAVEFNYYSDSSHVKELIKW